MCFEPFDPRGCHAVDVEPARVGALLYASVELLKKINDVSIFFHYELRLGSYYEGGWRWDCLVFLHGKMGLYSNLFETLGIMKILNYVTISS